MVRAMKQMVLLNRLGKINISKALLALEILDARLDARECERLLRRIKCENN